jgi:hypothetical protein
VKLIFRSGFFATWGILGKLKCNYYNYFELGLAALGGERGEK